jgi:hypothetical protein
MDFDGAFNLIAEAIASLHVAGCKPTSDSVGLQVGM